MKKIDRYILRQFILNFLVIAWCLIGLFLVIDFFAKLKTFLQITQIGTLSFILQYYLYRLPLFLVELIPIITLVAAMLTLTKLMKTQEFIPLLSSGISFYRILKPIFLFTLLLTPIVFMVNELVIPNLTKELSRTDRILKSEGVDRYILVHDGDNSSLVIEWYDYTNRIMRNIAMIKFDETGQFHSIISAQRGEWHVQGESQDDSRPEGWYLYKGTIIPYEEKEPGRWLRKEQEKHEFSEEGYRLDSKLKPEDLEKSQKSLIYASIGELIHLVRTHPHQPHLRMHLYNKFSFPLATVLLFLLGIPFILVGESHHRAISIGICLIVSLSFYIIRFLLDNLGSQGIIPPFLAVLVLIFLVITTTVIVSGKIRS